MTYVTPPETPPLGGGTFNRESKVILPIHFANCNAVVVAASSLDIN